MNILDPFSFSKLASEHNLSMKHVFLANDSVNPISDCSILGEESYMSVIPMEASAFTLTGDVANAFFNRRNEVYVCIGMDFRSVANPRVDLMLGSSMATVCP